MQDSSADTAAWATSAKRQPPAGRRLRFPLPLPPSPLSRRRTAIALSTCQQ